MMTHTQISLNKFISRHICSLLTNFFLSHEQATNSPSVVGEEDEKLSALFEKMMGGENGLPDENQLQTILQSFMEELMSKEIMYEPLKDMNRLVSF